MNRLNSCREDGSCWVITTIMNRSLAIVISVIFIDLLGFSLVLPLMPFYADRFGASDFTIGLLVASFAVAQFFATPWLGRLSDEWGRRPILLISVFGSLVGFLLWAFALPIGQWLQSRFPSTDIHALTLGVLFFSRILDGISGGNISVAQAYVTDVTTAEDRTRGLGLIGAAFGMGFILGPPIGGWLSANGNFAAPAYVSSTLAALNFLAILFFLPESRTGRKDVRRGSVFPIAAIIDALGRPKVRLVLWTSILFFMAFSTFTSIFSLYTLRRFGLSADGNGLLLGFVGVMVVLTQAVLVGRLAKEYGEGKILRWGILVLAVSMLVWGTAFSLEMLMIVCVLTPISAGSVGAALRSTITKVVEPDEVGKMLGVQASVESMTRAIGPLLGAGLMDAIGTGAPGIFCSIFLILLWLFLGKKLSESVK